MSGPRTVFLVLGDDPERWLRLGLWAVTAASVGHRVEVLLTAAPLRSWVGGGIEPAARALELGLPRVEALLRDAAQLAPVRVVSCDTEVRLAGIAESDAIARIDGLVSLPAFWRELSGATLVTL